MASPTPNEKGAPDSGPAITRLLIVAGISLSALFASASLRAQKNNGTPREPQVGIEASTSIVNLCPGEQSSTKVRLRATGVSPACAVRYTWSATGGRVVGDGAEAVWNLSGAQPGDSYDVTLTVETRRECGSRRIMSLPARVVVWSCPPRVSVTSRTPARAAANGVCPNISLCCRAVTTPGALAPFVATLSGGTPGVAPTFNWTLSTGEIAGGQGTNSILVDAKNLKAGTILTAVDVGGYGPRCSATCLTEVARVPPTPQPLTLSVSVKNARDGRPVPRARISVYLGEKFFGNATATETDGNYSSSVWTPGTYRVVVKADRFDEQASTVTLNRQSNGSVVFSLKSALTPTPTPAQSPLPTPAPSPSPTPSPTAMRAARSLNANVSDKSSGPWLPLGLAALAALGVGAYIILTRAVASSLAPATDAGESAATAAESASGGQPLAAAAATTKEADDVHCTVFAPEQAAPGDPFIVQVFAHLEEEEGRLAALAGDDVSYRKSQWLDQQIERGAKLTFKLEMPGLTVSEPEQSLRWRGKVDSVEFPVDVPADFKPGKVRGTVLIYYENIQVGRILFMFSVVGAAAASAPTQSPQNEIKYKHAFISYCSKDRDTVWPSVMGLEMGLQRAGITYFLDKKNLDFGDDWSEEIQQNLDRADIFYLFWSSAARDSKEVGKEITYALDRKDKDVSKPPFFNPLTIELPLPVPLPSGLESLNFENAMTYMIKGAEAVKAEEAARRAAQDAGAVQQ